MSKNKKIEKIEYVPDPYRKVGLCLMTPSRKWYAPEDDLTNQIDILRRTINEIIDKLNSLDKK